MYNACTKDKVHDTQKKDIYIIEEITICSFYIAVTYLLKTERKETIMTF